MKNKIKLLLVAVALCAQSWIYPDTMIITNLDYENDIVTVENSNGFLYQFYGTEDYTEGDFVSCIMWTNGTQKVTDDEIIRACYSGFHLCNMIDW